jgi:hypothetical protein
MKFKVYDGNPPIEVDKQEEADIEQYMSEIDGN